ncbi:p53 and DNA damage-regulated protein 1 isoform 1-T1 [Rhinophrynus dorsalis]
MERFGGPERVLTYLQDLEEKAEEVLGERQQIVALDMKRNQNREALRALNSTPTQSGPVTVCFGNMFINLPKTKTKEIIERDQEQLDKEIDSLRKQLRGKVKELNEARGKPELKGFDLTPLSAEEMRAIHKVLGGSD